MASDAEIAAHLFVAPRNVQRMRAEGVLPAAGASLDENRERYIRQMRETAAGRTPNAGKSELDIQKSRLAREQADQTALKNAAMRGELVPLSTVSQAVVGMIEVAKAKLKRLPAKLAPSDSKLRQRIADGIEQTLIDLSAERATEIRKPDDTSDGEADPDPDDD